MTNPALQPVDVTQYLGLAVRQAYSFRHWASSRGMSWDDLLSEARLALVYAAVRFNPQRGDAFRAYASTVIRNAVNKAIRRHTRFLSLIGVDGRPLQLPDRPRPDPDAVLDAQSLLYRLTPYERGLLEQHFGLTDGEERNHRRLATLRGVKPERIHGVLRRALTALRCSLGLLTGIPLRRCIRENPSCRTQQEKQSL